MQMRCQALPGICVRCKQVYFVPEFTSQISLQSSWNIRHLPDGHLAQSRQKIRVAPLHDVAEHIGIEHVALRHSFQPAKGSRRASCALAGRRFTSRYSSLFWATTSSNPGQTAGLRDSTTSPVRGSWRMKTSDTSKRKSSGKRTAWLRPVANIFAVCCMGVPQ